MDVLPLTNDFMITLLLITKHGIKTRSTVFTYIYNLNTASSKVKIINHKAADSTTHSYKLYNSKIIDRTKRES